MSVLNSFINIISTEPVKDSEGFVTHGDNVVASVRAYYEPKNSTQKWLNIANFVTANALFKFRKIPNVTVTTSMFISCRSAERTPDGRFKILSVEDVKQRGMYISVLAEKVEGSG